MPEALAVAAFLAVSVYASMSPVATDPVARGSCCGLGVTDCCERPGERGVVGKGCGVGLSAGLLAFQVGLLVLVLPEPDGMMSVALAGMTEGAGVADADALAELVAAR